jgi:sulfide:quinone oxidoreductase
MKKMLVLGAGTAGTMVVNKMRRILDPEEWKITVVDQEETHYYQPGFLFIPFGIYGKRDVIRPRREYITPGVELVMAGIELIQPDDNKVRLANGQVLSYDLLVIATGCRIDASETEGLMGSGWRKDIFDFYTPEGSLALARKLRTWDGGRLVVNVAEMPIKCPVAPLEFLFLADHYFHQRGIRDKVELVYATPLDGAFTKPKASALLGDILERKDIKVVTEFNIGMVDPESKVIRTWDEREEDYDLLVSVPVNKGVDLIERSDMGNELNFIPTDKHTLLSKSHDNIFVVGDATDLPSSKAGSVAHFQVDVLQENILRWIDGLGLEPHFDGHANCFIESGFGKGILIDFNYDTEPLPGKFPLPGAGPFSLLEETKMNHWGKMMFRWIYWNMLLPGAELPLEAQMSMAGKRS